MTDTPFGDRYLITETLPSPEGVEAYRATGAEGAPVVIKVVTPRDPAAFLDHVRTAAAVDHPHVVRVLDSGIIDDRCFVVYEAVEGIDLGVVLSTEGKVAPLTAAAWGAQAASGLAAVHARGLIHGSIRPTALLLTAEGTIKVLDLGLSEALGPADLTREAPAAAAYYISPEEVLARPLVPASDLYALGVVLYELATALMPIGGATAFEVAERHSDGLVEPPSGIDHEIPPGFDNVILRALSKAPHDRYATARAMQRDLERVVAGAPVAAPRTNVGEKPKRPLLPWIIAGVALALVATLAILWLAGVFGGGGEVKVPPVVGLSLDDAKARLDAAGFTIGSVTYQPADAATAPGTVIAQTPKAGTETGHGTTVDLVVAGSGTSLVPDVRGMNQTAAATAIEAAGLTLGSVDQVADAAVPAGVVTSQYPAGGTQAPTGSGVTITVSTGPSAAATPGARPVPNVVGLPQTAAQSSLDSAGYAVVVNMQSSSTVTAGTVIAQSPSAGVVAASGSAVTIVVSTGPASAPTPAPTPTPTSS
jgi:eukaryotic-like serine/threonine-protein kinase